MTLAQTAGAHENRRPGNAICVAMETRAASTVVAYTEGQGRTWEQELRELSENDWQRKKKRKKEEITKEFIANG